MALTNTGLSQVDRTGCDDERTKVVRQNKTSKASREHPFEATRNAWK
jgi:hypothetical protein